MNERVDSISVGLETIVVFIISVLIVFFAFLYAILYLGLPFLKLLPVINFDQIVSAFIYAVPLSTLIAIVYYRWRRH